MMPFDRAARHRLHEHQGCARPPREVQDLPRAQGDDARREDLAQEAQGPHRRAAPGDQCAIQEAQPGLQRCSQRHEIKAALFTLGEEVSNKQVTKIFEDFGNAEKEVLGEDGFKEFVLGVLGVRVLVTKDETVADFKLVNKGADFGTGEKMCLLEANELAFTKTTATPKHVC